MKKPNKLLTYAYPQKDLSGKIKDIFLRAIAYLVHKLKIFFVNKKYGDDLLKRYHSHATSTSSEKPTKQKEKEGLELPDFEQESTKDQGKNPEVIFKTSTTTSFPTIKLALVGDSTLDNEYWVNMDHAQSVSGQIEALGYNVTNLAIDGYTTDRVLNGGSGCVHRASRENNPYFKKSPLGDLKDKNFSHVVLSIGGNDIRERLHAPHEFGKTIVELQKNYLKILDQIELIDKKIRPVIMLQYFPDISNDSCYGVYKTMKNINPSLNPDETLRELMKKVYQPILIEAQKRKIPVIDTASTFDYNDTSLYKSQIEPSVKGGNIISRMIDHVIRRHDFKGSALCYQGNSNEPLLNISSERLKPLEWQPK